jgi:hypothetical protein
MQLHFLQANLVMLLFGACEWPGNNCVMTAALLEAHICSKILEG